MHAIEADELSRSVIAYGKERQRDEEAELRAWKAALTRRSARAGELGASGVPRGTFVGSTVLVALVLRGKQITSLIHFYQTKPEGSCIGFEAPWGCRRCESHACPCGLGTERRGPWCDARWGAASAILGGVDGSGDGCGVLLRW
ncbi:hypothetical protein ZWY2020_004444 [Hordeum vulgare]|nr:hypothetical protein ZWY2020_004444 [Hordeum vulgare]